MSAEINVDSSDIGTSDKGNTEPNPEVPIVKPKLLQMEQTSKEKCDPLDTETETNSYNYSAEMKINSFQKLKLNQELVNNLIANGIETPNELQSSVLSPLIQGRSMLIESPHRTGKMTAISIGLIQRSNLHRVSLQALIITDNIESCSTLELTLNILSEEATCIKLDDLEDVLPGEIAEHHFMVGSVGKQDLVCDVIDAIKSRVILCLYNVNLATGKIVDKILENKFKFYQILILREAGVPISYEYISELLNAKTIYLFSDSPTTHVDKIIHILQSKQTNKHVNTEKQDELPEIVESPNIEVCRKLESGEKLLEIFQKHNLTTENIPSFYIFVLHYLFKGTSVVQTGYKTADRVKLLCILAKEFNSHLNIPVRVVICHDGKEMNSTFLVNDDKVFHLKDEQSLNDIPTDKSIVVASTTKTLSVLRSFPTLFKGTGRIILFFNTQIEKFRSLTPIFPNDILILAMLKCPISYVENELKIPFVHVTKHEANFRVSAYQGAEISTQENECIDLLCRNKEQPIQNLPHNTIQNLPHNTNVKFHETHIMELDDSDALAMPNIVSVQLLETISAKHGINPKQILSFYPELFSLAIRGDNILLLGFSRGDCTPILNIVVLERGSSGSAPGCQVVLFAEQIDPPLSEYPHCVQICPSNEDNILDMSPIVRVTSISDINRIYKEQSAKFRSFKKLVVLVGVSFDECVQLIAEQMPCQFLFILNDFPSDDIFEDFPQTFVRFLNENGLVRIERVGREVSFEESTPYTPETPQKQPSPPNTKDIVLEIEAQYTSEISHNPTFFSTALTHVFNGDNMFVSNFYQDIVTTLVTILYQEYATKVPGGGHVLVCLGSRISDLLLPEFTCPSSLLLKENIPVLSLPPLKEETYFLTIPKMLNILNNEFDFLVSRSWFILFIGLSHQETQNSIPFIPLSNQYLFILSVDHPHFKKYMSAPYVVITSSHKKPFISTDWVHRGRMKSFRATYKHNVTTRDKEKSSIVLSDVASSILNSGKNVLIQASENSGKTVLTFDYILFNIDKRKNAIQVIFSAPTILSSVKISSRLNEYLRVKKENGIKAFLFEKGGLKQLTSFVTTNGFHVLITTNDSLTGVLKQEDIVKECCVIVFDELHGREFVDQSTRVLPVLVNKSIPKRIQTVFMTDAPENVSVFIQELNIPLYHIKETQGDVENICFFVESYL